MKNKLIFILATIMVCVAATASNDHPHEARQQAEGQAKASHQSSSDHHEEEGHQENHKKEAEENPQINPNKGITEAHAENGFKLSKEAEANFEIQRKKLSLKNTIEVNESAVVTAGTERNLYRYRQGFYKRIDFTSTKVNPQSILISSKELASNDEIVVAGMGFLRIAEIAAFGGAPEGHSH